MPELNSAILSIVFAVAVMFTAVHSETSFNHYSIVGAWELEDITGWGVSDLDNLGNWVETYFEDGTGMVQSGWISGDFTWSIQGNRLTLIIDGWHETTVNFQLTDSTFITYDPDSPEYPVEKWFFRRIQ